MVRSHLRFCWRAGTFLYIANVDIVRTEFELRGDRWQKWLLAALGFSMMAVLAHGYDPRISWPKRAMFPASSN